MSTKSNKDYILSIDVGTQSVRAVLIDFRGNVCDIVKTPITPYFSKHPGWAEQEPEYYWKSLCNTCKKLLRKKKSYLPALRGVTLTTQRVTMVNIDKNGKSLRPAITWLDQRLADPGKVLPSILMPLLKMGGPLKTLKGALENCEANWIMQNEPEIWEKTHKYLLLSGYLTYKLTGEFIDSTGNNLGYFPFDKKTFHWANRFNYKWLLFPIEKSKLPNLVKPSEIMGDISKMASKETGIPEGLPVFAAGTDKGCEILGSGCLTPETLCLSYGTIATVNTATKKYVEVYPMMPPYPGSVPDTFYSEVSIFRGFWMVSWFKEEFGLLERLQADKKKISPEKLFDKLIEKIPPGSMGLMLQPYWSPGIRTGIEAKGSIIGFGDVHTRAHVYRAILEGLAYSLKEGAILIEKKNGVKIENLRVSGGGSQSENAMQITADIFDLPAERPHTFETSALGAAIDAAMGLKIYPDFESAVKEMTRVSKVFEPVPENRDIYKELFERVYKKMYSRLKPIFKEIKEITKYPE